MLIDGFGFEYLGLSTLFVRFGEIFRDSIQVTPTFQIRELQVRQFTCLGRSDACDCFRGGFPFQSVSFEILLGMVRHYLAYPGAFSTSLSRKSAMVSSKSITSREQMHSSTSPFLPDSQLFWGSSTSRRAPSAAFSCCYNGYWLIVLYAYLVKLLY